MPTTTLRKPDPEGVSTFRLLRGGKAGRHARLGQPILVLLALATLFRIWTAVGGSQGILAEDTFGVLRQGRNLLQHGQYAFNVGGTESSAPLTLFGLLLAPIQALFGSGTPWFLLTLNAVLWTCAIGTLLRPMRPSVRPGVALLLCLAPAFVDGALHGTDAEWLGLLLALSCASVSVGRTAQAIAWFTLAVLSSPATCLFAPVLLSVHGGRLGLRFGLLRLMRLGHLAAVVGPVALWAWIANQYSNQGVFTPWLHWVQGISSPWTSLQDLWLGLPRYTLLAGTQRFPIALQHGISLLMFGLLVVTVRENMRQGTATSRGWLCFYLLLVAFGTGVSGSALEPAASILPAMAFTMALIPVLLPLVPRFHGTRLLRGSAIVLATLAMPIGFSGANELRTHSKDLKDCALAIETAQGTATSESVLVQPAGYFGFLYSGPVWKIDADREPESSLAQLALNRKADWVLVPQDMTGTSQNPVKRALCKHKDERALWEASYKFYEVHGAWSLFRRR